MSSEVMFHEWPQLSGKELADYYNEIKEKKKLVLDWNNPGRIDPAIVIAAANKANTIKTESVDTKPTATAESSGKNLRLSQQKFNYAEFEDENEQSNSIFKLSTTTLIYNKAPRNPIRQIACIDKIWDDMRKKYENEKQLEEEEHLKQQQKDEINELISDDHHHHHHHNLNFNVDDDVKLKVAGGSNTTPTAAVTPVADTTPDLSFHHEPQHNEIDSTTPHDDATGNYNLFDFVNDHVDEHEHVVGVNVNTLVSREQHKQHQFNIRSNETLIDSILKEDEEEFINYRKNNFNISTSEDEK